MKVQVLAKAEEQNSVWVATAYHYKGVWCDSAGASCAEAVERLKLAIEERLATDARDWLAKAYHGGDPESPNCPEGTVKLPIDLWYCRVMAEICPIQAQVFLREPARFFQGCLASERKKREIFTTVSQGKYQGFHHTPGRFLCVLCEAEGRKNSYYYPWELACIESYSSYVVDRDWPTTRGKLSPKRRNLSAVINAHCPRHSKAVAAELDPAVSHKLQILEFEIFRPAP